MAVPKEYMYAYLLAKVNINVYVCMYNNSMTILKYLTTLKLSIYADALTQMLNIDNLSIIHNKGTVS